ncbi:hypothetical protein ABEB36_000966 [Hypothenemus hampei]|uniref:tRNA (carboxymethyluridine(34)-5-O)-methyltransferase n=1 Tax=Hypothenemus hampei TaxID=57062 RepID=A0ABD1FD20_HYPHA
MSQNVEPFKGLKKLNRKLAKLHHILKRDINISTVSTPTNNLVLCNSGLVNGLTEDQVFEHFSKHGEISNITMLPGKSCCFVSFSKKDSATSAYECFNGKLNISQNNRPVYLSFVEEVPKPSIEVIWNELPPGLLVFKNFISTEEELNLLKLIDFNHEQCGLLKHRLVKHFGFEFRYDINNVDKNQPLDQSVPTETDFLWLKLAQIQPEFKGFKPDQLTVNHYAPGQGIPHHIDTHSAFEDPIICLSLGSSIVMEFKKDGTHTCVLLPQRSLLVMSGESRYDWTHGIVPRKFDIIKTKLGGYTCLKRTTRVSFTFRKVLSTGKCECFYRSKCDSFLNCNIEEKMAVQLEKMHVHKVYDNIANHFSNTRHKPWPNVMDFVQSFDSGDFLVDVGCGNGKYLSNNTHTFEIGCDRSANLIEICRNRKFEAFLTDCLSIPIRDNCIDGVISIAVIHHLANESRRLQAIQEIVRILKKGGKALIYVWAHEQVKNKQKSSYIMQDRKNRKGTKEMNGQCLTSAQQVSLDSGNITLPVHSNRSNFQADDLLVPWKLKGDEEENESVFLRFYHVFKEHELEELCLKVENVRILKSYYDQGNWCVLFQKM